MGGVTHTVAAGVPDGRTVGLTAGRPGAAADSGTTGASLVVLSDSPAVRLSTFFGGNRMLGRTATMSIKTTARTTRRSTSPLRVCASVRLASRYRVETAGVQRVAAQDPFDAEPHPSERAVALHRFEVVARARRPEAALRDHQMRQRQLVHATSL